MSVCAVRIRRRSKTPRSSGPLSQSVWRISSEGKSLTVTEFLLRKGKELSWQKAKKVKVKDKRQILGCSVYLLHSRTDSPFLVRPARDVSRAVSGPEDVY